MSTFAQLVVSGLVVGCIYGAIAMGYASIYSATGVITFTLGAQAMLAGYMGYVWMQGIPTPVRWAITIAFGALFAIASWQLIYRRIYEDQGALGVVIASFALSIAVQELTRIIASPDVRRAASPFGEGSVDVAGVNLTVHMLVTIGAGAALLLGAWLGFRSRWALMAKAVFQDRLMARALGIPTGGIVNAIFGLSGAATAIAGLLLAPLASVSPVSGVTVGLTGFVGAVLGGIEGVLVAGAGGVILGVVESLFGGYVSAGYENALVFGLLVAVLIVRPSGLLARRQVARV